MLEKASSIAAPSQGTSEAETMISELMIWNIVFITDQLCRQPGQPATIANNKFIYFVGPYTSVAAYGRHEASSFKMAV